MMLHKVSFHALPSFPFHEAFQRLFSCSPQPDLLIHHTPIYLAIYGLNSINCYCCGTFSSQLLHTLLSSYLDVWTPWKDDPIKHSVYYIPPYIIICCYIICHSHIFNFMCTFLSFCITECPLQKFPAGIYLFICCIHSLLFHHTAICASPTLAFTSPFSIILLTFSIIIKHSYRSFL